ncbi:hypothetical protein V5N11_029804 [Cardamine amara subsp. amara]|uniref:Retrotransposon Copia-like N-terminal domain-containing protein n=1 Tax=Cardamine amara subsp. amara TaxID=228776 RepID=A0ABD1AK54_CARAN
MSGENMTIVVRAPEAKITPYSLFSKDNPGSMILAAQLMGDNYAEWANEMMNALRAKKKLGLSMVPSNS